MIVAVLIVKNESHVLERCLRSVMPHVDGAYILDTGSTDQQEDAQYYIIKTIEREFDKKIVFTMGDWKGFAASRNEALEQAVEVYQLKPEDWLFMIDADDYVEAWEAPTDSWRTGYHVTMMGDGCIYPRVQLFQVLGQWRYVGVIHEFPEASSVGHVGTLKTVVRSTREGSRNRDPEKYLNDAKLIETELANGVDDKLLQRRYCFYLAQSYRDAGQVDSALNYYNGRVKMGGYADEVYVSYLEGMRLLVQRDGFTDRQQLVYMMLQAQGVCPQRRECVWQMMRWYREAEEWAAVTKFYFDYPPLDPPHGGLFVELTAYNYGMHDEAGVAYYWLGDYAASLKATLTAISVYPNVHGDMRRLIANFGHAQRKAFVSRKGKPMGSHSTTLIIEVCGIEREVDVDFTVDNYGSSGNGWDDAGDPVELYIEDVTDLSGPGQYVKYEALPDLSMKYHTRWIKDEATGKLTYADPVPAYGYGFSQEWRDGAWRWTLNKGRNLIEAMENMLVERIDDFTPDGGDDYDYEPSFYHADTRGEYDV